MDKKTIDDMINEIRGHNVWKNEFIDLFDVLENGLMKINVIPESHSSIVNLNLTSDFIMQKVNFYLKRFDLSIPQKNILECLFYSNCDMTQAQVSKFVFSSKSNISSLLNRMEEKKLIKRYENPKNKREKLIKLTKIGEDKLNELHYASINTHEVISSIITEKEAKQLNKILFKLKKGFEELGKSNGG